MSSRTNGIRVLIYSQDGFGLGHLRRNLNISLQIKRQAPSSSILIIADSPVAPFFKLPPKCDFIKLPTIVKVDAGVWRPNQLPMNYKELLKIRADIVRSVALSFRPHVFLVDHMPHGALGELAEPLKALKRHYPETKVVLGLRDILGAPDVIRKTWKSEGAFDAAEEYYDRVCIYGSPDVFDVTSEYEFPAGLRSKADYCGYVARDASKRNGKRPVNGAVAKYMPDNGEKFIMVTGGGGADAAYFMDKFLESAKLLKKDMKFTAVLSAGPFMHEKQFRYLRKKAKATPVRVTRIGADSIAIMRRADLVISMAGYNTVSEIMRFRKNAIIVPRPGPSAEQTMRTNILSERGLFHSIHPNDLTAEGLAGLVHERLHTTNEMDENRLPDLDGAAKTASVVLKRAYETN